MKAAVLFKPNSPLEIIDISTRKPKAHEVLVRTSFVGLCHTDLHFIEGLNEHPLPLVLGHEASGIVEQVGSEVTYVKPGDHVVTCLSVFCGECENCTDGRTVLCSNVDVRMPPGKSDRLAWDRPDKLNQFFNLGAFAEQILAHEHSLVKIRKDMPLDLAALLGCGVLTGVGAVVNTARVKAGETVAIIGCGGVGMAAVNGAAIAGAGRIIAIDIDKNKLEMAKNFGATDLLDARDGSVVEKVKEMTSGVLHHTFEALGRKETTEQAFAMLPPGGTATIMGMLPQGTMIELHGLDFIRERKIQGSSMGSNHFRVDIPRLIDFYLRGKLHLDSWISERMPLDKINEGFATMKRGGSMRSVIEFQS